MKEQSSKINMAAVLFAAAAAGFCNALIGAGGGILLTLVMGAAIPNFFSDRRQLLATSQASMIPGCLLSSIIYATSGGFDTSNFALFAVPALLGGALGSVLLTKIKPRWIGNIFSAIVIFSGFRMVGG